MIIACPACATRYVVPDSAIGVEGRTVRCAKCRHSWYQDGPELARPEAAPPAPPPPPPAPPPPVPPPAPAPVMAEPAAVEPQPEPAPEPEPQPEPAAEPEPASFADPADDVPAIPPPPLREDAPAPPTTYVDPSYARGQFADGFDTPHSSFAHEPPFRPRRNPARMWTIAAALFAVISLGLVGATAWYGLPDWMPFAQTTFAEDQPGLKLDFPEKRQDRHQLPNGTWIFGANGTVTNISSASRSVPGVLVVLRDARGRIVHSAEIRASKRVLAPGETVSINEALVPVPKAAVRAEFGWKPGA